MMRYTFVLILTVLLLMSGCASGWTEQPAEPEPRIEPVKLSLWGWLDDTTLEKSVLIDRAIAEFNETNTYNAEVEYQSYNEEFKMKITMETAANNAPDMFFTYEEGFLAPFVKSGHILPLNDLVDTSKFEGNILEHVTFDGKVFALPLARTTQLVYYNKALFKRYGLEVPRTMDEMLQVVRILSSNAVVPFALGNKDHWTGGLYLGALAYRHGGADIFYKVADGEINFSDPAFVHAAEDFKRLVDADAFEQDANGMSLEDARKMFINGQAAMWVMGSWDLPVLTEEINREGKLNPLFGKVDVFNWPSVEDGLTGQDAWITAPDYNIAISSNVKNKDAAVQFLKLLTSEKYQLLLADLSHFPATTLSIPIDYINPISAKLLEQIKQVKESITFPDRILGQQTIGGEFSRSVQELIAGSDAETTMARLEQRVQAYRE
jgi:raffinose/stachyose/melibiose transport system substrate-binding protein